MHDSSSKIAEAPAPAKINLCLHVGARRFDGYHPVCSVMEKIRLFDTLRTTPAAEGAGIRLTGSDIPPGENIIMRAARALEREIGRNLDVDIELKKEIPVAAGLAGGSSDAAAILKLLVFMFDLEVPQERLRAVALELGADVPFFLATGPQLAQGVGDRLEPVEDFPDYAIVLVKPPVALSTAKVYERYDEMAGRSNSGVAAGDPKTTSLEHQCRQLRDGLADLRGAEELAAILHNDLEAPARTFFPDLDRLKEEIMATGALGALMSGSGSAVFGIFRDRDAADAAATRLRLSYRQVWAAEPFRE